MAETMELAGKAIKIIIINLIYSRMLKENMNSIAREIKNINKTPKGLMWFYKELNGKLRLNFLYIWKEYNKESVTSQIMNWHVWGKK